MSRIDLKEYFLDLISLLSNSYQSGSQGIKITTDMKSVMATIDSAIPCGLIMNELVSNVFKHAFPGENTGEIKISLKKDDDGDIEIVVSDNGVGLQDEMDIRNINSLGLQSVVALTEHQLEGSLSVVKGNGTKFSISFKENPHKERF